MKKITLLLTAVFMLVAVITKASTLPAVESNQYYVNDQQIESLFVASTDISTEMLQVADNQNLFNNKAIQVSNSAVYSQKSAGDKSAVLAIVLNFFLGGLGIHRAYLGTATFTWVGYILTCGGIVGIVPLIDFIVLIVNASDISKYEDNPKFFMW